MTDEPLLVERDGTIETWTLNRPGLRNPITDADMVQALVNATERVTGDTSVRAVVLTGAGPAFSAGGNLRAMAASLAADEPPFGGPADGIQEGYRTGIQRITRAFYACEVPLVAAVNGPAIGAGCDLALMCDVRIASTDAVFAESFVKMGLVPGDGGAWLLPRVVGAARAAEMTLLGDPVDADRALTIGLVSRVVAPETLLSDAVDLAHRIAANPPQAVRMSKRLLRDAQRLGLDATLDLSASMQALLHQTADHKEAVTAFVEKRRPVPQGD